MKIIEFQTRQLQKNENHKIKFENHENNENHRIRREHHESYEKPRFPVEQMKQMKIIEFH